MTLIIILYIIMVADFLGYVSFIWSVYGIQKSISESYYVLPKKLNWLFVAFTWLFAFPAMILGDSPLMLFAAGGIVFVGAAAAMHKFPTRAVHLTGAISGMILGVLAMIFQYDMWYMAVGVAVLSLLSLIFDKERAMWWTEIIIFSAFTIVIGMTIFK